MRMFYFKNGKSKLHICEIASYYFPTSSRLLENVNVNFIYIVETYVIDMCMLF